MPPSRGKIRSFLAPGFSPEMIQLEPIDLSSRLPLGSGHALQPGTLVEAFEITKVLGLTSFGVMYLAVNTEATGRRNAVVIKEYLPAALAVRGAQGEVELRDPLHAPAFQRGLDSFVAEALTLSQFDHPNLLRVSCVWEANGTAYRSMPHYGGSSLLAKRFGMKAPLPEAHTRALLEDLLNVQKLLNDAGFAHGQIEPMNILMLDDGRPLLLDFDAARHAVLSDSRTPFSDSYSDTIRFQENVRADLRALAEVVHFAISGMWTQPVPGVERTLEPLSLALERFKDDAQSPAYSEEFLAVLDRMLAAPWAQRPASVAEFRALFDRGASAAPVIESESSVTAEPQQRPLAADPQLAPKLDIPTPSVEPVAAASVPQAATHPAPELTARKRRPPPRPLPEHVRGDMPPQASASDNVLALLANFGGQSSPNTGEEIEHYQAPILPTLTEEAEPSLPPGRTSLFDVIDADRALPHEYDQPAGHPGTPRPTLRRLALWVVAIALLMVVSAIGWQLKP